MNVCDFFFFNIIQESQKHVCWRYEKIELLFLKTCSVNLNLFDAKSFVLLRKNAKKTNKMYMCAYITLIVLTKINFLEKELTLAL